MFTSSPESSLFFSFFRWDRKHMTLDVFLVIRPTQSVLDSSPILPFFEIVVEPLLWTFELWYE
jgi:hypothetical protein